jgi:uncharacterized protein (DUF433 family)
MSVGTTYPHVIKAADEPARLEKHPRLRVSMIVTHYLAYGRSPDEICLHLPHLTPAEVYSAMTYYFDHSDEINAEIQAEIDQLDEEDRTTPRPLVWHKLRAKGLVGGP